MMIEIHDIIVSALRWGLGLSVGAFLGLILGGVLSSNKNILLPFRVSMDFLRAIPILGLVPIIQFYYGVGEAGKILLISWATMFPIAYSVRNSIKEIPVDTLLIIKNRRLSNINNLYYIVWLGALEGVYKSVNIAIGIGWLVVVASEMIGTYSEGFWRGGLGYRLFRAYEHNDPNTMFFVLALFGGLGILSATIWERIYKNYIKKRDSNGD